MTARLQKWEARVWPKAPPERLAVLRLLTGVWAAGYLVVRLPAFLALAHGDRRAFKPVGVLSLLNAPLPAAAVTTTVFVTIALAVAYTLGVGFRVTGPAFAIALLALTTYRSSWGQILWFETLVVVHVLIVGFAPSADALVVGRAAKPSTVSQTVSQAVSQAVSHAYGAPVRLAAAVTATSYLLSGIAKLRTSGLDWMSSDTLQNHIAYSAARLDILGGTPSPVAPWLVTHPLLLTPLAVGTVVLELGAPVALVGGWIRTTWVAAAWLMHLGIAVSLFVVWGYPLWGVAFAPLFRLERLAEMVRTRRARRYRNRGPARLGVR
jgi:hypothetical protein